MQPSITKAIIPVAGFGTRLLPVTKTQSKEMLNLVDKPVIHYLIEEAVESGITDILFVISTNKHAIGEYFTKNIELENTLIRKKKHDLLQKIQNIHTQANFSFVYQDSPEGSGHAILCGKELLQDEYFVVFYADDVMQTTNDIPVLKQLIEIHEQHQKSVAGLIPVQPDNVSKYGIIDGEPVQDRVYNIKRIVEKPKTEEAPSHLASVGRFILSSKIFSILEDTQPLGDGEVYLASALDTLTQQGELYGYEMQGIWHDCGSKLGLWRANIELGLQDPEIKDQARAILQEIQSNG